LRAVALLAAALAIAAREGAQEREPVLAERAPVAGLRGFVSTSTLVYHEAPDLPHRLVAIYVFPDRAVWRIELVSAEPGQRTITYRSGDTCWELPAGSGDSVRTVGDELDATLRRMELRRALTLWPDGFEWTGAGEVRRCELGRTGALEARLGASGRPVRMTSFDREGAEVESLTEITWAETRGRWFPASLELAHAGVPIWSERVESVQTSLQFLDYTFRPPDRRPGLEPALAHLGRAVHVDLREASVVRFALPEASGWPAAFERAAALRETAAGRARELGRELEPRPSFEVESGRPCAVSFLVDGPPLAPLPAGFDRREEVPAIAVIARGGASLEKLAQALAGEVPAGAEAGRIQVRADPEQGFGGPFQVVLPLLP